MEENPQDKTAPKDLIGKAERKSELSQKSVAPSETHEDPYGGTLKKTNFLLFVLIAISSIAIVVGAVWTAIVVFGNKSDAGLKFSQIQLPIILMSVGLVVLVISCILKSIVEKKRLESYSSTHEKKDLTSYKQKELVTEKAKLGSSTTENVLDVSDSKEGARFCPHCKKRIPESSGVFCPRCGKRLDTAAIDNND